MVDLHDVSVVVPVRIDSEDRLRNLRLVLGWLQENFRGHEVLVVEHAASPCAAECAAAAGAQHVFVHSAGAFHKSRVFNLGVALASRPRVLLHDSDIVFHRRALASAARHLRAGAADFVFPYNGVVLEVRCDGSPPAVLAEHGRLRQVLWSGAECKSLPPDLHYLHGTPARPGTGGSLLADRRALIRCGGFNENIVSYGAEDDELISRARKLGVRIEWTPGFNCFHLRHRRGIDSHRNNFYRANVAEWRKIDSMDAGALRRYVDNGFREMILDPRRELSVRNSTGEFSCSQRSESGLALDDVALALTLPPGRAGLELLVVDLGERLERWYDNYELHVIEFGSHHYRRASQGDHMMFRALSEGDGERWLAEFARECTRPILCLCELLTDVQPAHLHRAVEAVRGGARGAVRIPRLARDAQRPGPRERALRMLERNLPDTGGAVVFSRDRLLEAMRKGHVPEGGVLVLDQLHKGLDGAAPPAG